MRVNELIVLALFSVGARGAQTPPAGQQPPAPAGETKKAEPADEKKAEPQHPSRG